MKLSTYEQIYGRYKRLYKENKEYAVFYSKCIKLMHQIVQDIAKIKANEYTKTKIHITGAKAMSQLYEIKILHNFVAHQTLLKNGISIASYDHLRNIYETIIKIYLNLTHPDLGELNFKYETSQNNKELSKEEIKKIEEEYKKERYLKTDYIEKKIYSEDMRKHTREFYHTLSGLMHPSIKSMAPCYEFRPNQFMDSFKLGIGLTIPNFIILFELYEDKIKNKYKQRLSELLKEYPKYISEGIPNLIPSINNNKLKINNYNKLKDILN